jgi:mRNA interferase MazF
MPKPSPQPGEVCVIDAGYAAKVRPCLLLTDPPADNELDLVTVVFPTTALRNNRWELKIPKPFLREGAFHLQEIHSAPIPRLERRLWALSTEEFNLVLDRLAERLGI